MAKAKTFHPSEHQIQSAFATWCRLNVKRYPGLDMAFTVPNGQLRNIRVAMALKREGQRNGVLDWFLPYPISIDKVGLAIEFKSHTGKLTIDQSNYIKKLTDCCWQVYVCRSVDSAIKAVQDYYGERQNGSD